MGNKTLKRDFTVLIVASSVVFLLVLFGVRLMGKVTDFAYYERILVVSVMKIHEELGNPISERKVLIREGRIAKRQALNVGEAIFWIEKVLFRLLGQGYLLDVAVRDALDFEGFLATLNKKASKHLSIDDKSRLSPIVAQIQVNTDRFGEGLPKAAFFVKVVVNALVAVFVGLLIFLIFRMRQQTIPPLEQTVANLQEIAKGNLSVRVEKTVSGEIGQIQDSTIELVKGLRGMVSGIQESAKNLATAASANTKVIEELWSESGPEEQRQEIQNLTNSIIEVSQASIGITSSAQDAAHSAVEGDGAALRGQEVIADTVSSIHELADEMNNSVNAMQRIEADSEKIVSVVQIIQQITEQTNLLALNAAIEAARAGEYGRGFAVVADEVRTLAQRTQESTKEIQGMIENLSSGTSNAVGILERSHRKTQTSVEKANQASEVITEIAALVANMKQLNERIADEAEKQNAVTQQISSNTQAIGGVAEQTAIGGQNIIEANGTLVTLSRKLESMVGQFKL